VLQPICNDPVRSRTIAVRSWVAAGFWGLK